MGKKRNSNAEQALSTEYKTSISLQSARGYELSLPRSVVTANSSGWLYQKTQALLDELMHTPLVRKRAKKCTLRATAPGRTDIWLRTNSLEDLQAEFEAEYANRFAERVDVDLQRELCHDYADLDFEDDVYDAEIKALDNLLAGRPLHLYADMPLDDPMSDELKELWEKLKQEDVKEPIES